LKDHSKSVRNFDEGPIQYSLDIEGQMLCLKLGQTPVSDVLFGERKNSQPKHCETSRKSLNNNKSLPRLFENGNSGSESKKTEIHQKYSIFKLNAQTKYSTA